MDELDEAVFEDEPVQATHGLAPLCAYVGGSLKYPDDGLTPLRDVICPACGVRCHQNGTCPVCRVQWNPQDFPLTRKPAPVRETKHAEELTIRIAAPRRIT